MSEGMNIDSATRKKIELNLKQALEEYANDLPLAKKSLSLKRNNKTNSPNKIRTSFISYLMTEFPHQQSWTHPTTLQEFSHSSILSILSRYKQTNPERYKALYVLFTTQKTRAFVAERLFISSSTVRRHWDKAIDTVMVMLLYPELEADTLSLYKIN